MVWQSTTYCIKSDGKTKYDFSKFTFPKKFASKIYNKDFALQEVEAVQIKLKKLINKLNNNYNPTKKIKRKEIEDTLNSAKKLFSIRKEIIRAFKRRIFPYIDGIKVDEESDEESDEELDENKFFEYIENESKSINYYLFRIYFDFVSPTVLEKRLFETKDKIKNDKYVNLIDSEIIDLKKEIEKCLKQK